MFVLHNGIFLGRQKLVASMFDFIAKKFPHFM